MNTSPEPQAFDAFGEPTPAQRPWRGSALERRTQKLGIAIFWSLALLIVAGRIHYAPSLDAAPIELAAR